MVADAIKMKRCRCGRYCPEYVAVGDVPFANGHFPTNYQPWFCACGCGAQLYPDAQGREPPYCVGHQRKGKKHKSETIQKMRDNWNDNDIRTRRSTGIRAAKKEKPNDIVALHQAMQRWRSTLTTEEKAQLNAANSKRCREQYEKGRPRLPWCYGLTEDQIAAVRKRMSASAKRYLASLSPVEFAKFMSARRMYSAPNKLEHRFDAMTPANVVFVGDHRFWVVTPLGPKNPDFIVRPYKKTKKVIEVYGSYWHRNDVDNDLVAAYKAVGVSCLVVQEDEIMTSPENVHNKVNAFLSS